ncbi:nucleic acid/nucleotide deaminase domain-containing protein [Streptomyces sp. HMX87]|uniref:WXG100-like domain-containing protein n=1 Tax=Streptomyces sp. HMX87 TaxID=3390849 RepID=UPI003A85CCC4
MGKKLPDELVEILDLVGVQWPNIDEDEVRDTAKDYRSLAEGIRDVIVEGNKACSHIIGGRSKGKTVDALDRRWGKLTTKDLTTFAKALDDLGDALDDCAGFIEGCKVACIAELTATAASATAGIVGMFFTAGLSGILSAAAIAACRLALNEAIDYAVEQITSIVTDRIEAKILAKIEDVFTDRLDADDEDLSRYAAGGSDMAQDLVIEFDEFDRATGDYGTTRENFDKKKGAHKTGGTKRRSSVKKDSRFHKLAAVMDKCEDAVDKKADETVDVLEKHGGAIDKGKKEHKERDEKAKRDIDGCDSGDVPMYLLDADGKVQQLLPNGTTKPVSENDSSGINTILDEGRAWRPWTNPQDNTKFPISDGGADAKRVESTKIPPGSNELARATQIARYNKAHYAPDQYKRGGNYASGLFDDGSGRKFILVGYSDGPHSERMIGYPVLRHKEGKNLTALYTEREPCQERSYYCDQWLAKHFSPDLAVTHSAKYDQDEAGPDGKELTKYRQDREHREYVKFLEGEWKEKGVDGGVSRDIIDVPPFRKKGS